MEHTVVHGGPARALVRDLAMLARPRLAVLGLLVVVLSYVIAGPAEAPPGTLAALVTGSLLALCGASALNQVVERREDGLMRRTAGRPLPAGRVSTAWATAYGLALSVAGIAWLADRVNALTAVITALGLATYIVLYTPLKTRTSLATVVGAAPGAAPVLIGWAAARGRLDGEGWALFWILFLWQLPHFLAIAWMYRADYRRAGFRIVSVDDPLGSATSAQVVAYGAALLPASLVPSIVDLAGPAYFAGALALGIIYLGAGLALRRQRTGAAARRVLKVSVAYLPLLLALLAADRLLG